MAKAGYVCAFFLLVLAAFATGGLGLGTVHVHNGAGADILHDDLFYHIDGTTKSTGVTKLAVGMSTDYKVPDDTNCVVTRYFLHTPTVTYFQDVMDWCEGHMPVFSCLPDCYWVISATGFSVASSAHSQLVEVARWRVWSGAPPSGSV